MTTKELAKMLNTTKDVVLANGRKCFPNKVIEHGKTVMWSEAEVTVILDHMKGNLSHNASVEFNSTVTNTTTKMTNALKIHQAMLMMQEAYEDELKAIKAENERQAAQLIEQKPKVDYYDHYMDSKNNFEIEKLGKDSGIGARRIFKFLEADRVIRAKFVDGVKYYESYAYYDRYFQSVMVPFTLPTGEQYSRPKLMLTPEGMTYFMKKYKPIAA